MLPHSAHRAPTPMCGRCGYLFMSGKSGDESEEAYTWKDFDQKSASHKWQIRSRLVVLDANLRCEYVHNEREQEFYEEWKEAVVEYDRRAEEQALQQASSFEANPALTASATATGTTTTTTITAGSTTTSTPTSQARASGGSASGTSAAAAATSSAAQSTSVAGGQQQGEQKPPNPHQQHTHNPASHYHAERKVTYRRGFNSHRPFGRTLFSAKRTASVEPFLSLLCPVR